MTVQPIEPRPQIEPIDPDSPRGREISTAFGVLMAGVAARLRREGKPLPTRSSA